MSSPLMNRHLESKITVLLFIMVKFAKCAKKCPTRLLLPEGGSKMYLTDTLHLGCAEYKYKFEKKNVTQSFSSLTHLHIHGNYFHGTNSSASKKIVIIPGYHKTWFKFFFSLKLFKFV